jgi:hypothetical protein
VVDRRGLPEDLGWLHNTCALGTTFLVVPSIEGVLHGGSCGLANIRKLLTV